jgi:hypothetical protein
MIVYNVYRRASLEERTESASRDPINNVQVKKKKENTTLTHKLNDHWMMLMSNYQFTIRH